MGCAFPVKSRVPFVPECGGRPMTSDPSITIDKGHPTPAYLQLQNKLRNAILKSEITPGEALASERELAESLGLSRMTVRRALGALVAQKLAERRQGSGTYVLPRRLEQTVDRVVGFVDEAKLLGFDPGSRILEILIIPADFQVAEALKLASEASVRRITRLHTADGAPLALQLSHLLPPTRASRRRRSPPAAASTVRWPRRSTWFRATPGRPSERVCRRSANASCSSSPVVFRCWPSSARPSAATTPPSNLFGAPTEETNTSWGSSCGHPRLTAETAMTLPTEISLRDFHDLDTWPLVQTLTALVDSNAAAVEAVRRALPDLERAAAGVERALAAGGRLISVRAGTSGRLAMQDAAELPPTFGFEGAHAVLAGGEAHTRS